MTGSLKRRNIFVVISAAALLFAIIFLFTIPESHAERDALKVGYSDSDGVIVDEDGEYTGYVVEYLDAVSQYTGWEYTWVRDTWKNNMDKLEQGELDLLVMTHYTEERGERFLFSDLSMALDHASLYAAADSDIYYQDYAAFDGCRVGVVEGSIFDDLFHIYAQEQDLDYEIVQFETEAEAEKALVQGKIELIAASSFAYHSDVRLVDQFQLKPTYVAVNKNRQRLLDELNAGLQKLGIHDQELATELKQEYYGVSSDVTNLYLTREEQDYLDSVDPIVIKSFDERQPMSYTDESGSFVGILVDYLNKLGEICGVEFVYETTEHMTLEENADAMAEEGYGLVFMDEPLEEMDLQTPLYKSDALFQTALAYVRRSGEYVGKWEHHTFAVNSEMRYVGELLLETNAKSKVLYFDTSHECMDALIDGKAEMAILEEHVAAYLLQKPKFADHLDQVPGSGAYATGMCLYVPEEHQPLVSILNKTLEHLDEEQRRYLISNAMLSHSYENQMEDMLYESGILMGALAIILILAGLLYIRISRYKMQKKENEALQKRIQMDELTGVYNRTFFFEKVQERLDENEDDMYIVCLNVSHFKVINELYGSEKGDRLLQEIGHHLWALSHEERFVAGRLMADRFYLCIDRETFDRIGFERRKSVSWLGMDITLTYGVYAVETPRDIPVSAMCDRADMAIIFSEQTGSEYIYHYSDESRQKMLHRQEIENEMEQALKEEQFCIHIQPKYDVEAETIVGGEALVRWNHPQKGMIPPGDFIGIFERNGFILKLDHYVWEAGCRFLAEAKKKGLPVYPLSVNVSRIHFYGTELQDKLMALLAQYDLEPADLELEITESICSQEPEVIFSKCRELRKLGFKIAMDDFGSGYSSLNMLKQMPLDIIKMDLKFLSDDTDAAQEEKGRSILYALIELAHTLKLQVVVESLETKDQKDFICGIGRCAAQGYYFSKPVDCQSYEKMLGSFCR